ncbi:hypothetical protein EV401DRAFT_2193969 [Pisolithus croceorrhizus]|nr:hypothetical protein EV401DRAFT_2193969 [Pisolithus croceorrhizus]
MPWPSGPGFPPFFRFLFAFFAFLPPLLHTFSGQAPCSHSLARLPGFVRIFCIFDSFTGHILWPGLLVFVRIFRIFDPFTGHILWPGLLCALIPVSRLSVVEMCLAGPAKVKWDHSCLQLPFNLSWAFLPFALSFVEFQSTPPTSPQRAHNAGRQAERDQRVLGSPPSRRQPHHPVPPLIIDVYNVRLMLLHHSLPNNHCFPLPLYHPR